MPSSSLSWVIDPAPLTLPPVLPAEENHVPVPLQLTGYILEPPRVGGSNSPFTLTPNNVISDLDDFEAAYPSNESAPRTEYMFQVLQESEDGTGTGPEGRVVLPDATFAWTKNEGTLQGGVLVPFQRFDYSGQDQLFKPLQGAPRELVGTLAADANTTRLVVSSPPLIENTASFRIRISVGSSGSGTTFVVVLVTSFSGADDPGVVEMNADGELNWNAADITANLGAPVYFQRQSFFQPDETTGVLGLLGAEPLLLNPLPSSGQIPAIKIGSRTYLTAIERATEGAFSLAPATGSVEWALNTGRLKFSSSDITALSNQPVVYDGVFLGTFQVPAVGVGLAQSTPCGALGVLPSESSDTYFRIAGIVQFPDTKYVDVFDSTGKRGEVQVRRSDGAVQLSAADRAEYSGETVEVVLPDVLIERGVSLRLFRSPVNPAATTDGVKDVTAFYAQEAAILAEPMIGQPFVFLPAMPREDATLTVTVSQGTGSFVGDLQRLDVASPPTGKGYVLDLQTRQLTYAERKANEILPVTPFDFSAVQLPNAPVLSTGLGVELEGTPSVGDFVAQVEDRDFTIDLGSGVITYTQTDGSLIASGAGSTALGPLFTVSEDLAAAGVLDGDHLLILSGVSEGVYTILDVPTSTSVTVAPDFPSVVNDAPYEIRRGGEVLADRFFREVLPIDPNTSVERVNALGTITNSPRLTINPALAARVRFRFGKTTFSTTTSVVSSFTAPGSLAAGVVEVNSSTGQLNFSQTNVTVGGTVYWARELTLGSEYTLQPALGFIEFSDRMLEREEVHLRYTVLDTDGTTRIPVEERGTFLVPKEVVQDHPAPTSTLSFNPDSREVATTPAPAAFRGGRPQSSSQVSFNLDDSTVTFLADDVRTDALPHGATVAPTENVYIDYYIHEAIGGESNITVARPPMATVQIVISAEDEDGNPMTSFVIEGDCRPDFKADHILEVERSEVYLLAGSTYDGSITTVTLNQSAPQAFRSDLRNPSLRVTSGAIRRFAAGSLPSYFSVEGAAYDVIARGSKQIRLQGDLSRTYAAGSLVLLTDSLNFQEYNLVEGASYDPETNRTALTLTTGVLRQHSSSVLLRSVRPIAVTSSTTATTILSPVLTLPFSVYRQVEGEIGVILTRDVDYTIDDAGKVTFVDGLQSDEELGMFYTGVRVLDAGRRTRASWTFVVVPSNDNGLANQVLKMEYTTYIPDTFYYRVETLTTFRAELVEKFADAAKATSPSQGPVLENTAGTPLHEKGNPSLFFEEGDLDNQDLVARKTLVGLNNIINDVESFLGAWDGRAVGDYDGRFLFDGNLDNPVRTAFAQATNQIDDLIQVFGSTPRRAFEAASYSRFYPTQKLKYGSAADPTGLVTGDPILDLDETALRTVLSVRNRSPWAVTTQAAVAGSTTFQVDHAEGDAELLRPGLDVKPNLKVAITTREGDALVPDATPATVASTTPGSVTLAAPVGVAVPKGSTIRLAALDDAYRKNYTLGVDVGVDIDGGFLTHVSNDDIPVFFIPNTNPEASVALDVVVQVGATSTEPARFPALDGGTTDDDGNRQFPALSIDGGAELGNLVDEVGLIGAGTGSLEGEVTPSFLGSVTITSPTILERGLPWPAPTPKVGDLARLVSGVPDGPSYYHRVLSVGVSSVIVEPAFTSAAGTATVEITTGIPLVSRTGTLSSTTVLTDAGGNFQVSGVRPGHTVVGVAGTFTGQRRQVLTVDSATQITVTSPFTAIGPITYQIVDSLGTYGGATNSLQQTWLGVLTRELRALEGQDFVDFSDLIALQTTSQVATISAISMGDFSNLLVFVAVDNNTSGSTAISSATFDGDALTALTSATSGDCALHVYIGHELAGVAADLVITATDTTPSLKVYALKTSAIKDTLGPGTLGTAVATTAPVTLGVTGLSSVETGDLVASFVFTGLETNEVYPFAGHEALIPQLSGNGLGALLTVSRATAAQQSVAPTFRVIGANTTSLAVTLVLTKDCGADPVEGRGPCEKTALERLLDDAAPDRGLGIQEGAIVTSTIIEGDFTNIAEGDVVFIRHGPNAGVRTVASATDSQATVVEPFAVSPQSDVEFRAGRPSLVTSEGLQDAFVALQNVELAIVETGSQVLLHHCPIPVYRNAAPSGGLPGTLDSVFAVASGRLTKEGAYARGISGLSAREAAVVARAQSGLTDQTSVGDVLATGDLYDGRFVWIDGRINLETGILPKRDRAVENRRKALENIVKNLTKLLTA